MVDKERKANSRIQDISDNGKLGSIEVIEYHTYDAGPQGSGEKQQWHVVREIKEMQFLLLRDGHLLAPVCRCAGWQVRW